VAQSTQQQSDRRYADRMHRRGYFDGQCAWDGWFRYNESSCGETVRRIPSAASECGPLFEPEALTTQKTIGRSYERVLL
jgi:hypothetical protein